jgi:hypothetical protein
MAVDENALLTTVYKAEDGWRWRAKNRRNGRIVAESGEAFVDEDYAALSAEKYGPFHADVVVEKEAEVGDEV